jgi:hypothetical protein
MTTEQYSIGYEAGYQEGWNDAQKPQRPSRSDITWVGLTDEQYLEACKIAEGGNYMVAFQRIQQWLKESNT